MQFPRGSSTKKISHALSSSRNKRNGGFGPENARIAMTGGAVVVVIMFLMGNMLFFSNPAVPTINSSTNGIANSDGMSSASASASIIRKQPLPAIPEPSQKHHLIFSTSCHFKQDWQSYVFFFQAMMVRQPGDVTRIVSGCSDEDRAALEAFHKEKIAIMSDRFHVHFTPDYSKETGANFQLTKYWNKPFGVRHWLEHTFGYSPENMLTDSDDDVVILVDPDMLLQRPIVNDFTSDPINMWTAYFQSNPDKIRHKVEHGKPISQIYGFGKSWLFSVKNELARIVGEDSPVHQISMGDAARFYPAGPPYMATTRDMYNIALHWTIFTPKIFEITPIFMSEMHGYSMAAAHLGMPHQLAKGFMTSNVVMTQQEGWDFLDKVDPKDICDMEKDLPNRPLVIHFCQRYSIGEFFQSKYKTHHEILTCDHPLLEQPPKDAVEKFDYSHYGNGDIKKWPANSRDKPRHGFMVCKIMDALNGAAIWFKDKHCPDGANYNKVWNFFRDEGDDIEKKKRKLAGKKT